MRFLQIQKLSGYRTFPRRFIHSKTSNIDAIRILGENMQVYDDFITEEQEESLLTEAEKSMKRLRYESSHWDDVSFG